MLAFHRHRVTHNINFGHRNMSTGRRGTFIHLHNLDLRLHDSPSLFLAHDSSTEISKTVTHFLPVYIFDERQIDLSELPGAASPPSAHADRAGARQERKPKYPPTHTRSAPQSRVAGFHRTSPTRLAYLLESVFSLRESYRRSGGDMLIGYGRPEVLIPSLVESLGDVAGVWAQREYSLEEAQTLGRVDEAIPEGVDVHYNDSKTLIPPDVLPFDPASSTPDLYTTFRKKVEGLGLTPGEGMLVEPLQTAKWDTQGKEAKQITVSVGTSQTKLKPFPSTEGLEGQSGSGWIQKGTEIDTIEGLFSKLSKSLIDNPPHGGWSSTATPGQPPATHPHSAIPFSGGEAAALSRLEDYVGHGTKSNWTGGEKAKSYKSTRNGLLGEAFSTKFASMLALGTLSPKEIGWRVGQLLEHVGKDKDIRNNVYYPANSPSSATPGIIFELLWRDYFQFTTLHYSSSKPSSLFDPLGFSSQISSFPANERPDPAKWHRADLKDENDPVRKWCEGRTGVPFIDAAMKELVETGYMSNRSRQNVASFLTKDLYADWRIGAEFFEMHLVDYDTCSNWGNWQYQAGVGNDARASRQFNPIKQAADYDPKGEYVRLWLPELRDVPDELVQTPWLTSTDIKGYPSRPVVEGPHWKKHYHGGGSHGSNGRGRGNDRGRHNRGRGRGGHKGPRNNEDH